MMNKRRIFFSKITPSLNVGGEGDKLYTNDSEYTEKNRA